MCTDSVRPSYPSRSTGANRCKPKRVAHASNRLRRYQSAPRQGASARNRRRPTVSQAPRHRTVAVIFNRVAARLGQTPALCPTLANGWPTADPAIPPQHPMQTDRVRIAATNRPPFGRGRNRTAPRKYRIFFWLAATRRITVINRSVAACFTEMLKQPTASCRTSYGQCRSFQLEHPGNLHKQVTIGCSAHDCRTAVEVSSRFPARF